MVVIVDAGPVPRLDVLVVEIPDDAVGIAVVSGPADHLQTVETVFIQPFQSPLSLFYEPCRKLRARFFIMARQPEKSRRGTGGLPVGLRKVSGIMPPTSHHDGITLMNRVPVGMALQVNPRLLKSTALQIELVRDLFNDRKPYIFSHGKRIRGFFTIDNSVVPRLLEL